MTKALLACRGFYFSYILFWPCISYLAHVTWAKKNEKSIYFFFFQLRKCQWHFCVFYFINRITITEMLDSNLSFSLLPFG